MIERDIPLKESFNTRVRDSAKNLKRKAKEKLQNILGGSGYKTAKTSNFIHSNSKRGRGRVTKTKRKSSKKTRIIKYKTTQLDKKKRKRKLKVDELLLTYFDNIL